MEECCPKPVIGLTGTIGSGKSRVGRCLAGRLGLAYIDLDLLCADLLQPGRPGWQALRDEVAPSFFLADGSLDRRKLRRAIFQDNDLRRRMDNLLHPLALAEMRKAVTGSALVEVPLLFEAGWRNHFDAVISVYASPVICCRRIMERDGVSADEAARSLGAQLDPAAKALRADWVINNSGPWWLTVLEITHLSGLLGRPGSVLR